jgi:hypothetical protein
VSDREEQRGKGPERADGGDKDVEPQIEFESFDEEWLLEIELCDHVVLLWHLVITSDQ